MGLCLICQAAVSSTLKFISEGPQSVVAVAPLRHFRPATQRTTVTRTNHNILHTTCNDSCKSNDRARAINIMAGFPATNNTSHGECAVTGCGCGPQQQLNLTPFPLIRFVVVVDSSGDAASSTLGRAVA